MAEILPGMLVAAAERLGLLLAKSWIAGDCDTYLMAGRAAGLAGGTVIAPDNEPNALWRLEALGFRARVAVELPGAMRTVDTIERLPTC